MKLKLQEESKKRWNKDFLIGIEKFWLRRLQRGSEYADFAMTAEFLHCTSGKDAIFRIEMHRNIKNVMWAVILIGAFTALAVGISVFHIIHSPQGETSLDKLYIVIYGLIFVIQSTILWRHLIMLRDFPIDNLVRFVASKWDEDQRRLPTEPLLTTFYERFAESYLVKELKFNPDNKIAPTRFAEVAFNIAAEAMSKKIPLEESKEELELCIQLERLINQCIFLICIFRCRSIDAEPEFRDAIFSKAKRLLELKAGTAE